MNATINKLLLAGDKFIPEMHLKQPGFRYSDYSLFTKNRERIKKIKEIVVSKYIYQNELE